MFQRNCLRPPRRGATDGLWTRRRRVATSCQNGAQAKLDFRADGDHADQRRRHEASKEARAASSSHSSLCFVGIGNPDLRAATDPTSCILRGVKSVSRLQKHVRLSARFPRHAGHETTKCCANLNLPRRKPPLNWTCSPWSKLHLRFDLCTLRRLHQYVVASAPNAPIGTPQRLLRVRC